MTMPMAACNQIIGYLDELLDPTAYDDYGPNGLQVPGSEQIQTVVTGVSANAELFARARGGRRPRARPPRALLGRAAARAGPRLQAPPAVALRRQPRARRLEDAIAAGLDAFVTGEPAERSMARAREAEVHFLAAGHYATETFGVRALGERLAERFGIRHVFVDVPNPI
jgi:putative NIF3 family GTP cyclohydrolase 1 type 2